MREVTVLKSVKLFSKKFDFSYEPHTEGNCLHCDWEVDQSPLPALG